MGNLDVIENREQVQPSNADFEPMPAGTYVAEITKEELGPTSKGDGLVLKIVHTILEGQHKGRTIFSNMNVTNPNEKAQQIGRGMLSSLGRACGLPGIPSDSSAFLMKPHLIKVVIESGKGLNPATNEPYPAKNVIRAFYPLDKKAALEPAKPVAAATEKPAEVAQEDDLPDFLGGPVRT